MDYLAALLNFEPINFINLGAKMIEQNVEKGGQKELVGPASPKQGIDPTYKIDLSTREDGSALLKVGFGRQAQNDEIVRDAVARVREIVLSGELNGKDVTINGPASLPVAVALAHELGHVTKSVRVFDPKLNTDIVSISHDPSVSVGKKVDAPEKAYRVEIGGEKDGILTLKIGFGRQAQNDEIVADALDALKAIGDTGVTHGKVVLLNGPASLPVAAALGYKLAHISKAVAAFDPKLNKGVIAISHGPDHQVGDLIG